MVATLRFNMDNEDDRLSFRRAVNADKLALALEEVSQMLRQKCKYGDPSPDMEQFREEFHQMISEIDVEF